MLKTRLTVMLGIDHPIVLAPMGSATSPAFAAAVSNAGALGSIGTLNRPLDVILRDLRAIRGLTSKPFAINHIPTLLMEEAFQATLDLRPAVVSFALGDPGDLVRRVHDAGSLAQAQVTTVAQASQAAERGVDIIVAQGSEAGGHAGTVSTLALVPQVVDAVSPLPVIAAGGIFDGRGLAAALLLGAVGVNLGTRFLASHEAPIDAGWQRRILDACSEDSVKAEALNAIYPEPGTVGYGTAPRALRSPFIDHWNANLEAAGRNRETLRAELTAMASEGRRHEIYSAAGQSAGGVRDVISVEAIICRIVEEAERALSHGLAVVI